MKVSRKFRGTMAHELVISAENSDESVALTQLQEALRYFVASPNDVKLSEGLASIEEREEEKLKKGGAS